MKVILVVLSVPSQVSDMFLLENLLQRMKFQLQKTVEPQKNNNNNK